MDSPQAFSGFEIPNGYLALIGISQGVYVLGKVTGGNLLSDLDKELATLRGLEEEFCNVAVRSDCFKTLLEENSPVLVDKLLEHGVARNEYAKYMQKVEIVKEMVHTLTGNCITPDMIQPRVHWPV